jgi:hypothetical protein
MLEFGAEEIAGGACNTLDTIARATWCLAQCQFGFLIRRGMVSGKDEQGGPASHQDLGKMNKNRAGRELKQGSRLRTMPMRKGP